ncbi:MAG: hypothetical protein U5K69_04835 [Balneolaceae bacterium]|nr:hypothetical protein [Balneolaceae bacterium]
MLSNRHSLSQVVVLVFGAEARYDHGFKMITKNCAPLAQVSCSRLVESCTEVNRLLLKTFDTKEPKTSSKVADTLVALEKLTVRRP